MALLAIAEGLVEDLAVKWVADNDIPQKLDAFLKAQNTQILLRGAFRDLDNGRVVLILLLRIFIYIY